MFDFGVNCQLVELVPFGNDNRPGSVEPHARRQVVLHGLPGAVPAKVRVLLARWEGFPGD